MTTGTQTEPYERVAALRQSLFDLLDPAAEGSLSGSIINSIQEAANLLGVVEECLLERTPARLPIIGRRDRSPADVP
jgi:hypothetical protein